MREWNIIKPSNLLQSHFGSDLIAECEFRNQKYKASSLCTNRPFIGGYTSGYQYSTPMEEYPNGFTPIVIEPFGEDNEYIISNDIWFLSEDKDKVLHLMMKLPATKEETYTVDGNTYFNVWVLRNTSIPEIPSISWELFSYYYPYYEKSGDEDVSSYDIISSINIYKMTPDFEAVAAHQFVRYDTNSQDLTAEEQENARTNIGALSVGEKGQPNGVATLDSTGKVPLSQLPNSGGDVEGNAIKSTGQQSNLVLTSDGSGGALWSPYLPGVTTLAFIQEQIESSGGNFSGYWFEQKYPPVEDLSYDSVVGGLKYGFVETIMNRIKNIIEYELLYVIGAQDSDGVTVSVSIFPYTYDADMNEMKSFFEWSNCLVYERDEPPDGTPYWHENWVNFDRNIYYGMFTTPFSSLVSCSVIYENNSAGSTYDMVSKHLLTIPISLEMIANAFDIYWGSHPEE